MTRILSALWRLSIFRPSQWPPWLRWLLWDFSGLRFLWRKIWPEEAEILDDPQYRRPATFLLWVIALYAALYGIAETRYENALDRVENRMNAVVAQLSTGDEVAFENLIEQLPRIQRMKTPLEPDLLPFPGGHSALVSFFVEEPNPEILAWTRETIETWKRKLGTEKMEKKDESEGVNLIGIDLSGASLREANLSGASLSSANLSGALLDYANLSEAELWGANFSGASLSDANLSWVMLAEANLSGALLAEANLSGAGLWKANLSGADLREANLQGLQGWKDIRDIRNANILDIENAPEGFRAWALERGAVEMEREEWKEFRENGYKKPASR
uniref:Pentapeptide repeat-containing protein n=1 Tax=Candidatus Kentrum sp. TUN TaxID=2126343 RepID=A0A451A297_9GAMM|nr:MAG: Pentapeptide repeat-containing protein [Candidatus Kentron sp. TUN]VFK69619.1 MAG: Pentapeptide repeat-containing protein [Candidatus Kentron sp. TUN]